VAASPSGDVSGRFDVMPDDVADELRRAASSFAASPRRDRPFRLVVRRSKDVLNSFGRDVGGGLRRPANPCFVHPDDLGRLGIESRSTVIITSDHGSVRAIAEADDTMRPGVVSMSHGFGGLPSDDGDPVRHGSSANCLLTLDRDLQAVSAMPQMSALAVSITPGPTTSPGADDAESRQPVAAGLPAPP
jgi:anaerobic selenocysteine-containing dehydrogenase